MAATSQDLKFITLTVTAIVIMFFVLGELIIVPLLMAIVVIMVCLKLGRFKSKLTGELILIILTMLIYFFGISSPLILGSTHFNVLYFVLAVGFALTAYGIAVAKVCKYFGIPTHERLSELSPGFVSALEIAFPGIGFTYMGVQKGRNYTIFGLAIFLVYIIGAIALTFSPLVQFLSVAYLYSFIFRLITPIVAYRTVKKLKAV